VPRAGWVKPSDDQHLSDHVALGVLTRTFSPKLVDDVLAVTGRQHQRQRLLPARLVVYYVLAMTLFSHAGYEEVMRSLVEGLSWQSGWRSRWQVPSKSAIFYARARLGVEPLRELFQRTCVPLATQSTPGGFYRSWRVVSVDGTTLEVADTPENVREFGRPRSGRGEGAFPQLRVVALAECGTHSLFALAMGGFSKGEKALARELLPRLSKGMLLLADRYYFSFEMWQEARSTGADLLWRTKSNHILPVEERLADGSYISHIRARDRKQGTVAVRVVEYNIEDPGRRPAEDANYRLITTILAPEGAPATDLAGLYGRRWEFETVLDELKTHQRGPRVVLRSKNPEGVSQEAYGFFCTHYAIRALMAEVADGHGVGPDRVSFTRSLRAVRRSVRAGVGASTKNVTEALRAAVAEIGNELLPERRLRAAARVVKRKISNYGTKRPAHASWPQPTLRPSQAVQVIRAPT
jgi:Insertion element 4 transposase N-terminal/Transposase DDE domain